MWESVEVIEGRIPEGLRGMFTRIGPNSRMDMRGQPLHIFDGDGMAHGVTFTGNEKPPSYVKLWVETRRLLESEKRGFDVPEFGAISTGDFASMKYTMDPETHERMGKVSSTVFVSFSF